MSISFNGNGFRSASRRASTFQPTGANTNTASTPESMKDISTSKCDMPEMPLRPARSGSTNSNSSRPLPSRKGTWSSPLKLRRRCATAEKRFHLPSRPPTALPERFRERSRRWPARSSQRKFCSLRILISSSSRGRGKAEHSPLPDRATDRIFLT